MCRHFTLWEREQSFRLQPGSPQLSSSFVDGVGGGRHLVLHTVMQTARCSSSLIGCKYFIMLQNLMTSAGTIPAIVSTSHLLLCYLRPVVMVSQRRIHRQVGEVLPDGLGHVGHHLDHHVCRELIWRDMRWTVTGGEDKQDPASSNQVTHMFMFISIPSDSWISFSASLNSEKQDPGFNKV